MNGPMHCIDCLDGFPAKGARRECALLKATTVAPCRRCCCMPWRCMRGRGTIHQVGNRLSPAQSRCQAEASASSQLHAPRADLPPRCRGRHVYRCAVMAPVRAVNPSPCSAFFIQLVYSSSCTDAARILHTRAFHAVQCSCLERLCPACNDTGSSQRYHRKHHARYSSICGSPIRERGCPYT